MQHLYAVTAEKLKRAKEKENTETEANLQNDLKIGDLVWVRNVNSGVFKPKYSPNYRIIAIYGNNHIAVKAPDGKVQVWHRGHIKKIDPVDKVISLVPSAEDYQKFRRKTKLLIHPDNIPDTNISLPSRKQTKTTSEESEIGENYQDLCEKLKTSSMKMLENKREQTKMTSEESEIGKNYQDLREKLKTSSMKMLENKREQTKMTSEESEIGKNYQDLREKLKTSSMKMLKNNREQTKMTSEEIEIGENYQDSCEKTKASSIEMVNSIDCSVETLNEVNISLISAPCPLTIEATRGENIEVQ